jgi:predicted RNA-binding Zn ribbon-like protein
MDLKLLGGAPALDFVNTRDPLVGDDRREYLDSPQALAEWGRHAGLLAPSARLRFDEDDLDRALEVRALLERLFTSPRPSDRRAFPRVYAEAVAGAELAESGGRFDLRARRGVDTILFPVLDSARELLTGPDRARVRRCESDDCGWFFVDRSRAGTRRWCRMDGCGARAKMRRYRARRR